MKIGVVVHGPEIVDSGYAEKILNLLKDYGTVKARLGGTMGRTAVIDAELEDEIDISEKLLPSESVNIFQDQNFDVIFLINYGKSSFTGHAFGFKVFKRCKINTPLIQIERPGEADGSVIAWRRSLSGLAEVISTRLSLRVVNPIKIMEKFNDEKLNYDVTSSDGKVNIRKIAGVSPDENIFINGMVVGRSRTSNVSIVTENGVITQIIGGELKKHSVEKLGKIHLADAIIKTGLLRKSEITPRVLERKKNNGKYNVAFLNHAAEDIYKLKDVDMVVTVGDDTTLVAADILYRFKIPIVGITDGDIDYVVKHGFKASGSLIVELENGWDDLVGQKIFFELFKKKENIEIENIENFKRKLLQIIKNTAAYYNIKEN